LNVEPIDRANRLQALPNVILTPHVSSFTNEAWLRIVARAVDNVLDVLAGRLPEGAVNPDVLARHTR
ncbi:MAG: hypothetical protein ACP5QO_03255, partial [Clostridia bacterium]